MARVQRDSLTGGPFSGCRTHPQRDARPAPLPAVQISWSPAFRSRGRTCPDLVTVAGQFLMSLDTGGASQIDRYGDPTVRSDGRW